MDGAVAERPPLGPMRRRIGSTVVWAGFIVVALIAFGATTRLGELISDAWAGFPGAIGYRGVLLSAALTAFAASAMLVVHRAGEERLVRWMPWAALALLVGIRAVVIPLVPTPIPADDDPRYLHELAVGVLDGGNPLVAHRPMGYSTMLAALYALFGPHPWLAELLNLAFALLAGWALYRLVHGAWGIRAASLAVVAYAIVPSQVLMVTVIFTETTYAGLLLAALALAAVAVRRESIAVAVAAGVVLAISQYVRPVSQLYLLAFVVLPFVTIAAWRRAATLAGVMAAVFVVTLLPIAVHNATVNGSISLSTSSYGGWSVFVGANQQHNGRFNRDDQRILASLDGSVWRRSEILGRAGVERITSDPAGFASLAVRKFRVMWADDTAAAIPALSHTGIPEWVMAAVTLLAQLAYAGVTVGAAVALWQMRSRPPPEAVLLGGVLVLAAAAHVFVEVQPRYHAYLVPLLAGLAAVTASRMGALSPR